MAKGDVNSDRLITYEDYILIKNAIAKVITLNAEATKAADWNGDKKITVADLEELNKVLALKITGDANGDGVLSQEDVKVIEDHIAGKLKLEGKLLKNADVNNDGKVDKRDVDFLKNLIDAIIEANKVKNNKITIQLNAFEKGEYLSWFVTTQAAYEVTITLKDDSKTYFTGKKKGTNIAPPLAVGNDEYSGKNLRLEISIPESDDIKTLPTMSAIITNTGKIVGHNFICCGEDWIDANYSDFYINIVGWKHKN